MLEVNCFGFCTPKIGCDHGISDIHTLTNTNNVCQKQNGNEDELSKYKFLATCSSTSFEKSVPIFRLIENMANVRVCSCSIEKIVQAKRKRMPHEMSPLFQLICQVEKIEKSHGKLYE